MGIINKSERDAISESLNQEPKIKLSNNLLQPII